MINTIYHSSMINAESVDQICQWWVWSTGMTCAGLCLEQSLFAGEQDRLVPALKQLIVEWRSWRQEMPAAWTRVMVGRRDRWMF